jgi:hypothetical protein
MFPRVLDSSADTPIEGYLARLVLKDNVTPVKHKAYPVPFGLLDTFNSLLDNWVAKNIAVKTRQAVWASPGFLVPKKSDEYRIVVDFKKTLNPQLRIDYYPILVANKMFESS